MFRFEHIDHLWYLLGIIPLVFLLAMAWKWHLNQGKKVGDLTLVEGLAQNTSPRLRQWQNALIIFIFLMLIIAWSNPQWGAKRQKVSTKSADIFIALDISNSMYSQDVAPSRMDQAKRFAMQLTEKLKGERIGLILFAGNAYLQMPLTNDYAAAQLFIQSANPGLAGSQGTAIGDAIQKAKDGFSGDEKYHRVMVIISDGEDHDTEALTQAKTVHEEGMIIFTVGVGTAQGSFIPMQVRGNEDWKRDDQGQPVRTKLNETLLQALAQEGGGSYFYLNSANDIIDEIDKKVDVMEKREFEERSFTEYESYYQVFLGMGILGMILFWSLSNNLLIKPKS
ncbi:MAG: VWA domain-containing protein [Saprospiraceae bacterium]|nr:VWA domain-containing protein [Saprospiraceae bacterium]